MPERWWYIGGEIVNPAQVSLVSRDADERVYFYDSSPSEGAMVIVEPGAEAEWWWAFLHRHSLAAPGVRTLMEGQVNASS